MTFEGREHVALARTMLDKGQKMMRVELFDEAGRAAYLAAFHAAQAFLFDRLGRLMKTHAGVQAEFGRVARTEPGLPVWLHPFLSQAFEYKSGADYGVPGGGSIGVREATDALARAAEFVTAIEAALGPLQQDDTANG